jgi:hypothetical protein
MTLTPCSLVWMVFPRFGGVVLLDSVLPNR